jgi:hypothetical protein
MQHSPWRFDRNFRRRVNEQRAHGDDATGGDGAMGLSYPPRKILDLCITKHSMDVRSG